MKSKTKPNLRHSGTEVLTRFVLLSDGEGAGSAEHHQVQQRVSPQSVGTVDTGTRRLTAGIQSRNHLVNSVGMSDHLRRE